MTDSKWFSAKTPEPLLKALQEKNVEPWPSLIYYASRCTRSHWNQHNPQLRLIIETLESRLKEPIERKTTRSFLEAISSIVKGDFLGAVGQIAALAKFDEWMLARMSTDTSRTLGLQPKDQAEILRDLFPPISFSKITFETQWSSEQVLLLAKQIDENGSYNLMPILSDALQESGCHHPAIIEHALSSASHNKFSHGPGCWVIENLLRPNQDSNAASKTS